MIYIQNSIVVDCISIRYFAVVQANFIILAIGSNVSFIWRLQSIMFEQISPNQKSLLLTYSIFGFLKVASTKMAAAITRLVTQPNSI